MTFDDVNVGVGGVIRHRNRAEEPWGEVVPCTVVEVDRRDDHRVWSIRVRDERTGKVHRAFCPPKQKAPGVWNGGGAFSRRGPFVWVRLGEVEQ
jgi:hypothetical protein